MAKKFLKYIPVLMLVVAVAAPSEIARGDYIEPGNVVLKTLPYTPAYPDLREGTYNYEISWQGIPVAKSQIRVNLEPVGAKQYFHVEATARTARGIDILYRLRHRSDSFFEAGSYRPSRFFVRQRENSRVRNTQISFEQDGRISSRRWKNGKEESSVEFYSNNQTLDPISGAFLARTIPIHLGSEAAFDVFNGRHRYLISFKVVGKETIEWGENQNVSAFKIVPTVKKLTETKEDKRLKSATLWITDDERRDIVRLESKMWLGSVVAELRSIEQPDRDTPFQNPEMIQAKLHSTDLEELGLN